MNTLHVLKCYKNVYNEANLTILFTILRTIRPLVPKFAGSNPAEAVGFLGRKKSSAHLPSEGK